MSTTLQHFMVRNSVPAYKAWKPIVESKDSLGDWVDDLLAHSGGVTEQELTANLIDFGCGDALNEISIRQLRQEDYDYNPAVLAEIVPVISQIMLGEDHPVTKALNIELFDDELAPGELYNGDSDS